jgi:Spy/CpxP family protein refolding chaperone
MMRAFSTTMIAALVAGPMLVGGASAAFAAPAPAHPAAAGAVKLDPVTLDVRCLITMAALGQDKTRQQAAQIGAYFFAGRLSARAPGLDLPSAIKAQEMKMTPQELPAEAQRCGPMVQATVQSLQRSFSPPAGAQPAPGAAPAPAPAPVAPSPK